jgi:predicted transposase/invertase (TIGR01784 family)
MTTDPLFYRLFATSPETFFQLLGMPAQQAVATAARYDYRALEFKKTSRRVDGVFLPKKANLPLYFLEVQFYRLPSVFANLLVKAYTYLANHDPGQAFFGVVLFADRSLLPDEWAPYQCLLDCGQIQTFFLDEMPEVANVPLGLAILHLMRQTELQAPVRARALVVRAKKEIGDKDLQERLIQLIETIIMSKPPRLSREEIHAVLQLHDIHESRPYQESVAEGLKKGLEQGLKQGLEKGREEGIKTAIAITKLAAEKKSVKQIASALKVKVALVRQVLLQAD